MILLVELFPVSPFDWETSYVLPIYATSLYVNLLAVCLSLQVFNLGRLWPSLNQLGQIWVKFNKVYVKCGRIWLKFDQSRIRPDPANLGQNLTKPDPSMAEPVPNLQSGRIT